uniref:Transmembrane protein 100 n=1 Tax=Cynoglossus semilaevis TaxID=244447 RepID=A0A3P8WCC3_CYNSE
VTKNPLQKLFFPPSPCGDKHSSLCCSSTVLSSLERLTQATGGMEKSWYRCIFPFGIICLVIGVAGTGVTYTYNDLPQTKVVSVVLLVVGFLLLILATACWTVHKKRKRKKKEGGSLTSEQCPL